MLRWHYLVSLVGIEDGIDGGQVELIVLPLLLLLTHRGDTQHPARVHPVSLLPRVVVILVSRC